MSYAFSPETAVDEAGYERVVRELCSFISNPGLDELANLYATDISTYSTEQRLVALGSLASAHWDFRKGAERQSTDWSEERLNVIDSSQSRVIFSAAAKLGMVASSCAENKCPDYLVVLGGANRSPLDRLRYGMEQTDDFGQILYMGSDRPLGDAEKQKANDYAPGAETEYQLGVGAFTTYLGAEKIERARMLFEGETWGVELFDFALNNGEKKRAVAFNSPQMIGTHRATTYDNYRFLARIATLHHHLRTTIVSVTTGFYVPAQHAPALQEITLPYGVTLETIGHDAGYSGANRTSTQLLQETKAAIDAHKRLYDSIAAAGKSMAWAS